MEKDKSKEALKVIDDIELKFALTIEKKQNEKVKQYISDMTGDDGDINSHGVWRTKNKIFPKHNKSVPMAII